MKAVVMSLLLFAGQIKTLQDKPVIHLPPHQNFIPVEYGGHFVEMDDAPITVQLPQQSPTLDFHGHPWSIDVENFGPATVTIVGRALFRVRVSPNQTVHIKSSNLGYSISQ